MSEYDSDIELPPGKVIVGGVVGVILAFATVAFIVFAA